MAQSSCGITGRNGILKLALLEGGAGHGLFSTFFFYLSSVLFSVLSQRPLKKTDHRSTEAFFHILLAFCLFLPPPGRVSMLLINLTSEILLALHADWTSGVGSLARLPC